MLTYPQIDPIAFTLGPVKIYWYGLMYLLAFAMAWGIGRYRAKQPGSGWTGEQVNDLIFYCALGIILGGRIGYMLFYGFATWTHDPLMLFRVWEGGMSFHGGLLGVIITVWLYGRKIHKGFWEVGDFIAPLVPLGLAAGRVGNFINNELWGRTSDVAWAMISPGSGGLARHPSQLYEGFFEGVVLFIIIWWFSSRSRPTGSVAGLFLMCYAVFRFVIEFYREPDLQLGFIAFDWMTMGQILCVPMFFLGAFIFWYAYTHRRLNNATIS